MQLAAGVHRNTEMQLRLHPLVNDRWMRRGKELYREWLDARDTEKSRNGAILLNTANGILDFGEIEIWTLLGWMEQDLNLE